MLFIPKALARRLSIFSTKSDSLNLNLSSILTQSEIGRIQTFGWNTGQLLAQAVAFGWITGQLSQKKLSSIPTLGVVLFRRFENRHLQTSKGDNLTNFEVVLDIY